MASAAIGVAGDDAVAAVGHAWRRVAQERPGLYAATDRHPCTNDPELEAAVERIVEVIAMSLASFDLDPENRVHAARTLRSAFHGFSHIEIGMLASGLSRPIPTVTSDALHNRAK